VNKVFISILGDENQEWNREAMANADRSLVRGIDIEFYDAATAPIWQQ